MTSYHIIGVGGAGMSAIAHLLLDQGHHVSGCDLQDNALTGELAARGARIDHGHSPLHLEGADIAVISSAIRSNHPEVIAAHEREMPVLKRADLWRRWSESKPTLAIAGTHGKTTTTAMAALILSRLGYDPAFVVPAGGPVPGLPHFARWGAGPFVIEADEYDRLFLGLLPEVAIITNVDWDHVDIYPSRADVEATFAQFARQVRRTVIACDEDEGVRRVRAMVGAAHADAVRAVPGTTQWQSYGFGPGADWHICDIITSGMETHWTLQVAADGTGATPRSFQARLQVPGQHNVLNAVAAVAAVAQFGVQPEQALEVLADFRGAARRFEWKGDV